MKPDDKPDSSRNQTAQNSNESDDSFRFRMTFELAEAEESDGIEIEEDESEEAPPDPWDSFDTALSNFVATLDSLWRYTEAIEYMADETNSMNVADCLELLRSIGTAPNQSATNPLLYAVANFRYTKNGKLEERRLRVPVFNEEDLQHLSRFYETQIAARAILYKTVIQQLANSFEQLLAKMLQAHYGTHPNSAPKDRTITYSELLAFSTLEDARQFVLIQESDRFLRLPTEEQLGLLERHIPDLRTVYSGLDDLTEVLLARHAIVHAEGTASREYVQRVRRLKNYTGERTDEGGQLPLTRQYVEKAWRRVFVGGCIIVDLCWKKALASNPQGLEASDVAFNTTAAYRMLRDEQWEIAEELLMYAKANKRSTDAIRLYTELNLAIALKGQGRLADAYSIIDEPSWKNRAPLYQLACAAIREDLKGVDKWFSVVGANDEALTLSATFEWPVFRWVRNTPDFKRTVRRVFGRLPSSIDKHALFKVLDPKSGERVEQWTRKIKRRRRDDKKE